MLTVRSSYTRFFVYAFFHYSKLDRWLWILYLLDRGYSMAQIGIAESIFHLTTLATEVPTGYLADRYGKRMFLVAGGIATAASSLLMLDARSLGVVICGMALRAVSYTLPSGTDRAFLHDAVLFAGDNEKFNDRLSLYAAVESFGLFATGVVGGLLAARSWVILYAVEVAFGLTSALTAACLPAIPSAGGGSRNDTPSCPEATGPLSGWRRLAPHTGLLILVGVAVAYWSTSNLQFLFAQPLLASRGLSSAWVAVALATTDLLSMVGARLAGFIPAGVRRASLPWLPAGEAVAVGLLLVPSRAVSVVALGASQALGGAAGVILDGGILEEAPPAFRSTSLSGVYSGQSLVVAMTFPVLGAAADRHGLPLVFIACAAMFASLSVLAALAMRRTPSSSCPAQKASSKST